MKNIQFLILIVSITFFTTSCLKNKRIKPSKDITKVEKTISGYDRLSVSHAFDVDVTFSDTEELIVIEADDNLQEYIIVEQDNDKLVIRLKQMLNIKGKATLKVHITTKEINDYSISGASGVTLNNPLVATDVSLNLSGASNFNGEIEATNGKFDLSGASKVDLNGSLSNTIFEASGASNFSSYDFHTDILDADLSGASDLRITVTEELNVEASGASSIKYKGDGVVNRINLSGASTIKKRD